MKKMRITALLLALVMIVSFAACGGDSGAAGSGSTADPQSTGGGSGDAPKQAAIDLSMACSGNMDGTLPGEVTNKYIGLLDEWSDGALTVTYYPNAQLGGDVEIIEGVQLGSISIMQGAPTAQIGLIPELALLDIPGLFSSMEACNEVLSGEFKDMIQEYYNKAGLQLLDCYADSFRELSSNKAVNTIDDFKGLDIRTMENKYHMAFWKELGTNPTPLAFGELYIALQQGMLVAQENPLVSTVGGKIVEVQDYIVLTHHIPFINTYVMNKAQYDDLSDENKELLQRFLEGMHEEIVTGSANEYERLLGVCASEYDMEIIEVSDEMREYISKANAPVIEMMKKDMDPVLVDNFVAAAAAAEAKYAK